jgi:phosphosulfolactate synthase
MIQSMFGLADLPDRTAKPRTCGMTLLLDKGLAIRQVEDLLSSCSDCIDVAKLGWGTAVITPDLDRKLELYRAAGIPAYFGGTLLEAYYMRGQLDTYRRLLNELGVDHVEVSDGTLEIEHEAKLNAIRTLAQDFTVLSEVGS